MRLGIFGGTFNPVHFGHLRTAEEVREAVHLDSVIFIPSGNPPLKGADLIEAPHRYEMVQRAVERNRHFRVSDIELRRPEKSYTVTTLQELTAMFPGDGLFFILGVDAFLDIPNWWQPDQLMHLADFIIVTRPGFDAADLRMSPYVKDHNELSVLCSKLEKEDDPENMLPAARCLPLALKSGRTALLTPVTPLAISSTGIRRLVKDGRSISYLLPEAVEEYIQRHHLYR